LILHASGITDSSRGRGGPKISPPKESALEILPK
jgi:hypothetical protein